VRRFKSEPLPVVDLLKQFEQRPSHHTIDILACNCILIYTDTKDLMRQSQDKKD